MVRLRELRLAEGAATPPVCAPDVEAVVVLAAPTPRRRPRDLGHREELPTVGRPGPAGNDALDSPRPRGAEPDAPVPAREAPRIVAQQKGVASAKVGHALELLTRGEPPSPRP